MFDFLQCIPPTIGPQVFLSFFPYDSTRNRESNIFIILPKFQCSKFLLPSAFYLSREFLWLTGVYLRARGTLLSFAENHVLSPSCSSTRNFEIKRNGKSINEQSLSWPSQRLKNVLYCSGKLASSLNLVKHILDSIWPYRTKVSLVVSDWLPMENSTMSDYLICNENREFLYENEGIPGINPDFVYDLKRQTDHSKMANDFAETTRIVPNKQTSTPTRKRKRNSVKDRMRAEAEQTAYKKLKELIPSLRGHKRITKLQTIREACLHIQNLQKTLTGIRKG